MAYEFKKQSNKTSAEQIVLVQEGEYQNIDAKTSLRSASICKAWIRNTDRYIENTQPLIPRFSATVRIKSWERLAPIDFGS